MKVQIVYVFIHCSELHTYVEFLQLTDSAMVSALIQRMVFLVGGRMDKTIIVFVTPGSGIVLARERPIFNYYYVFEYVVSCNGDHSN